MSSTASPNRFAIFRQVDDIERHAAGEVIFAEGDVAEQAYVVRTAFHQAYLRNQLVNSEEGAPMGVGIWFEMFVNNPKAYLFQNSDPLGSLKANVATAIVKQLSNLKLDVLLENRDALSRKVREEVSPTSTQWGFSLGSTYIRKVAFRDQGFEKQIEQTSADLLSVNYGTLYPALLKLEQEGYIASEWGFSDNNRKARFYQLTRAGRKQLERETQDWEQMTAILARFLKPRTA